MRIVENYSHLNGYESLKVHKKQILDEIKNIIKNINANNFKTKISKEKTMKGKNLFNPVEINKAFKEAFYKKGWKESRYAYCVTTDEEDVKNTQNLSLLEQKEYFKNKNKKIIPSYNQTDFVKDKVAVEVQFGKYAFVAYDLFVKHMLFYTGGVINVGVEILPMKEMQKEMSSGVAYYEGEVYNLMRQGRTSPPVPLLIIGIAH
ncbi:MAG: restriction endonuclease [Candidatus Aenigmarchaeota archaeon]|nr:restriction endonuclease [Candidatus Aenigmarchaeota archaeon]